MHLVPLGAAVLRVPRRWRLHQERHMRAPRLHMPTVAIRAGGLCNSVGYDTLQQPLEPVSGSLQCHRTEVTLNKRSKS